MLFRELAKAARSFFVDEGPNQRHSCRIFNPAYFMKFPLLRLHSKARLFLKRLSRTISHKKTLNFFSALIKEGDLVFDVGANMGDMTAAYLKLGARVVSIEPQEICLRALQRKFGRNIDVALVSAALGRTPGELEMRLSDIRPQLSSMSPQWIAAVKASGRFPHYEWSRMVRISVTTLDCLISEYGIPDFCKLDVEGFEHEVLRGLSQPLPCLSFEYHVEFLECALDCLSLLDGLGNYIFNFTVGNRLEFELPTWVSGEEVSCRLTSLAFMTLQGDIYARLDPQDPTIIPQR